MILQLVRGRVGAVAFLSGPRPVGAGSVPRFHFFKIVRALRRSSGLVLGGGELFQSRTSWRSLVYYLVLPLLSKLLGRPVTGFSLALDPDLGPVGRWLTSFVLRGAKGVWVRDETSRGFLSHHSVAAQMMPDIVWAWPAPKVPPPVALRTVLWIPRFSAVKQSSLWTALGGLSRSMEQGFLAFHPSEDGKDLARFRNGLTVFHRLEFWTDPAEIFERIARYDLVVTMRYHGLVAAVLAGRPVVAIPGHGKVLDLARELNVPTVDPSAVSSTDWAGVFRRAFDAGAPSAGDRPARAAAALEELGRGFDNILLYN